jgi:outer membrane protein assembly factor BamB
MLAAMSRLRRTIWCNTVLAAAGAAVFVAATPVLAQPELRLGPLVGSGQFELSDTVQLDRADSAVRAQLERVKAYVADGQWDEAVQGLREVMENSGAKLLAVTDRRYISVRDYCHLQLVGLPAAGLALYRGRVDPLARKWYEDGVARHDRGPLLNVVEQAFASTWGDDALMALGEMALESGDYASARFYWERIIPAESPKDAPRTWLGFPDTTLDVAAIRARLVLASILEGSLSRARGELARYAELHPDARGRFGGRDVKYAEALREMLTASGSWPAAKPSPDWPTFAGSAGRNKIAQQAPDAGPVAWRVALPKTVAPGRLATAPDTAIGGVAEDAKAPLSYHPVISGELALVNTQSEITAIDLRSGKPAWGRGVVFRDRLDEVARDGFNPPDMLGVPRFTMSVCNGRLYARMGSAVTARPQESAYSAPSGYLVCLDIEAEGRLVWEITPEEKPWAFDGAPLVDGTSVYVAMRRSEVGPQAQEHVACYDAESGRLRWRTFVCGAETPTRGMLHQATCNLLTLQGDTLYFNTNLGAVAAISARDGQIRWISLYPRDRVGNMLRPAPHWSRDLTPCLYDRGTLLVAPCDSPLIFALDAATGQVLWQTGPQVEDVVHLLGVAGDCLIASGRKLYWIGLIGEDRGKVKHVWPDGADRLGYGRGVLAGARVYWPTREAIYVFDQATARQVRVIQLPPLGITGGNLLVTGRQILVSTANALIGLTDRAPARETEGEVTWGRAGEGRAGRGRAGEETTPRSPGSQAPAWEPASAKLRYAPREAELPARAFPSWSLGTEER